MCPCISTISTQEGHSYVLQTYGIQGHTHSAPLITPKASDVLPGKLRWAGHRGHTGGRPFTGGRGGAEEWARAGSKPLHQRGRLCGGCNKGGRPGCVCCLCTTTAHSRPIQQQTCPSCNPVDHRGGPHLVVWDACGHMTKEGCIPKYMTHTHHHAVGHYTSVKKMPLCQSRKLPV